MSKKLAVLIVDDDGDNAEVMRLAISAYCGADTWAVPDAKTALELARELPHLDAIVLDVGLPETDGLTLARWIRADARFKGTTLIALTGYVGVRTPCLEAGCDYFVLKPADVPDLCRLIELGRTTS